MSVTESIWAMVNLTLSALAVIWLTASYAKDEQTGKSPAAWLCCIFDDLFFRSFLRHVWRCEISDSGKGPVVVLPALLDGNLLLLHLCISKAAPVQADISQHHLQHCNGFFRYYQRHSSHYFRLYRQDRFLFFDFER